MLEQLKKIVTIYDPENPCPIDAKYLHRALCDLIGQLQRNDNLDALCDIYNEWVMRNELYPVCDAQENLLRDDLTDDQRQWLSAFSVIWESLEQRDSKDSLDIVHSKQENCECGLDEKGIWSETVFDRFGCDCE